MNIDALAAVSWIICGICCGAMGACIICGITHFIRADRRSRSQLRRSLGTLEAGR